MMRVLFLTEPFDDENRPAFTHVCPVPNTIEKDGFVLCDALVECVDDVDGEVIGVWCEKGKCQSEFDEETYLAYLAPVVEYDDEGEIISSVPRGLVEVHNWAGWPQCVGV